MSNLSEMSSNIRAALGHPKPQRPSPRQMLYAILRSSQSIHNAATNANDAWSASECSLNVLAGREDYQVSGASFGKPLQVVTVDDSNPAHIEREIPFFQVSNLNFNYSAPNDVGAWNWSPDGSNHTAIRMAFFRKDGVWTVRVLPTPQLNAKYRILFSVGDWASMAELSDIPVLPEHHHLIEVRAAGSLLPLCEWYDENEEAGRKANAEKRREFAASLGSEAELYTQDFERRILNLQGKQLVFRDSYQ